MHTAALLLSALLIGTDANRPAPSARAVETIELATLTPRTARPGPGRFVFLPAARLGIFAGCVVMEADGPKGVLRIVEFDPSEPDVVSVAPLPPIVVEGVLVIRHHPDRDESPAVEELLVREARRVR